METRLDVVYEAWGHPDLPFTLKYSFPVFQEIDFLVNEGYRCIPYGGIEHAGLLFGNISGNTITIEAFRSIESEHSVGPSFYLSERDIEKLEEQLRDAHAEPSLAGLVPLGLFVSHSRRDLTVTSHEAELLSQLFPEPWQTLLLIKPEKFKPTRFGAAFRSEDRLSDVDLQSRSFVLPSPRRSDRRVHAPDNATAETDSPIPEASGTQSKRQRAKRILEDIAPTPVESAVETAADLPLSEPAELTPNISEDIPAEPASAPPLTPLVSQALEPAAVKRQTVRVASAFAVAVLLVGLSATSFYWNQLQPPISLHASPAGGHIIISWQAKETTGAAKAQLKISSDHVHRTLDLSPSEKRSGQATISVTDSDLNIELVVRHWFHGRHGAIRVVSAP